MWARSNNATMAKSSGTKAGGQWLLQHKRSIWAAAPSCHILQRDPILNRVTAVLHQSVQPGCGAVVTWSSPFCPAITGCGVQGMERHHHLFSSQLQFLQNQAAAHGEHSASCLCLSSASATSRAVQKHPKCFWAFQTKAKLESLFSLSHWPFHFWFCKVNRAENTFEMNALQNGPYQSNWVYFSCPKHNECTVPENLPSSIPQSCHSAQWFLFFPIIVMCKPYLYDPH